MKVRPSIIIQQNNKILTLEYNYSGTQVLALPGGNLEFGESIQETIIRELEEELGVKIEIEYLKFIAEVHAKPGDTLHMVFVGKVLRGTPVLNPKETSALGINWIDINSLPHINLYPNISSNIHKSIGYKDTEFLGEIEQPWY